MTERHRTPTSEEIYAIGQAARQLRAETIARLLGAAARQLGALAVRGAPALAGRARRTATVMRRGA
jgi:hypothetical protein